jgi:hypothetical protein
MLSRPRKPLLIVPIRDRRQSRRVLTVKNCAITMLSVAVIFASISVYNEARRGPAGEYGRLFGKQVSVPNDDVKRNVDVIHEGDVTDQSSPDPMLVAPAAREQILMANTNVPTATVAPQPVPVAVTPTAAADVRGHGTTIVGDGNGVTVVKAQSTSTAPRPVLAGGIFKQQ